VHDIFGLVVLLFIFSAVVFFAPEFGGYFLEYNNFIPADPLKTPAHIAPVWYFTPYYSMLRATTDLMVNVLGGIVAVAAVLGVWKGRFSAVAKLACVLGAGVAIWLLKTFDAKFWGVVMMGDFHFELSCCVCYRPVSTQVLRRGEQRHARIGYDESNLRL
jgi:ubiquinol-cytochrome c reductase cytochrome b subunit